MALPSGLSVSTLFGGAMVLLGGVILAVSGRYVWRATAVLRATDRDTLENAPPGTLARASGTAIPGDAGVLSGPFSGVECLALRQTIEERRLSFLYVFPWYVTLQSATGAVEFSVRTPTGDVPVVEPVRTVVLETAVVETVGPGAAPSERVETFLRDRGDVPRSTVWTDPPRVLAPLFGALSLGTRRYSEQRAERGAEVTAVGRVTDDGSGIDPIVVSDRGPIATLVRMAKTSIAGVLVAAASLLLGYVLLVLA